MMLAAKKIQVMTLVLIGASLLAGTMTGCHQSREETFQLDAVAHFTFSGNLDDALVAVSQEGQAIWTDLEVKDNVRYEIAPGTYDVKVHRDGVMVVHRKVYLGDGNMTEIRIP